MSFINVDTYQFDRMVDERIEQAFNVASEYSGCGLFDADGKLVDTGSYQLTKGTLLEIIQYQQEQITYQKDLTSALRVSDGVNSNAIEMLLERVKVLENAIVDIRDGMHGLKEINDTIRNLKKEVEKL